MLYYVTGVVEIILSTSKKIYIIANTRSQAHNYQTGEIHRKALVVRNDPNNPIDTAAPLHMTSI